MIYNVDFHGTIADNLHDRWVNREISFGRSVVDTSNLWDDYAKFVHQTKDVVVLHTERLQWLEGLKKEGHVLRLFTNANYTIATDIKHILGNAINLFDDFIFANGRKSSLRVEGVVVDNEVKNLQCGIHGNIFVPTFEIERR
jgi:hypothetical protein